MKALAEYLRKIRKLLLFFILCLVIQAMVCFLYDVPVEVIGYGTILCVSAGIVSFLYGFFSFGKRRNRVNRLKKILPLDLEQLPEPEDPLEQDYQEMIRALNEMRMESENARRTDYGELTDYYTMWVHQIKTPISALRLLLDEESSAGRAAAGELMKIEEYVEMVLGYLRTEDMSSDMNFQTCSLDKIVREQIKKYARIFIGKKISLEYGGAEREVLTDPKWLGFVIGQILSNSLKYTKKGRISIFLSEEEPLTLVIEDTGIGIRGEDVPRVFEKGFTGYNGRGEAHSTGIGLYLSAKIMKRLGHGICLESVWGQGTRVCLELDRKKQDLY